MNLSFYKLLMFTAFCIPVMYGQNSYNPYNHFNLLFESSTKVNPYFFSDNPAYLNYDGRDQMLSVKGDLSNEDGSFKNFFDPGTTRNYNLSFSGKKNLDSTQTFKGLFAIQRLERNDWNFLATRDYNTGSPFLLGDSTSGSTRYNGIFMNAQYSAKLFNRLLTGFSINYFVDEGLKEVSPRPTSEHRDIDVTAGFGYIINDNFSAGLTLRTYDKNEKITYADDEGSVYTETILFKVRGFDLPERNAKKTETRFSYNNGYSGKVDGYYNCENLSAVVFAGNSIEQISVKDNSNNPSSEGYWKNNSVAAGAEVMLNLSGGWNTGCLYRFTSDDMWAKHPAYDVLISSSDNKTHEFGLGVQYSITEKLSAGIEFNASLNNTTLDDYYSDVYYEVKRVTISPLLGLSYTWSKYLYTHAAIGIIQSETNDVKILTDTPTDFYTSFTSMDINYISADYSGSRCYIKAEINPGIIGLINLYIAYTQLNAGSNAPAYFNNRNNLQASIEFKIKAY